MKICFFGSYVKDSFGIPSGNGGTLLKKILGTQNIKVTECHEPIESILSLIPGYFKLFLNHRKIDYDIMIIPWRGILTLPLAKLIHRKPIIYFPAFSIYDTLVSDRKKIKKNSLKAKFVHLADKLACKWSDKVKRYIDTFGIKQVKIIIFEEFIKNPKKIMEEILEFLEIIHPIQNFKPEKFNSYFEVRGKIRKSIRRNRILAKIVKLTFPIKLQLLMRNKFFIVNTSKPKINNDDKEFLKKLYQLDVEKLQTILPHNPTWKNFSNFIDEKIDNSKNEI